jgi:hypothetical protein
MFRVTWAATASTYGVRFGYFCWRRYDLKTGDVNIVKMDDGRLTGLERNRISSVKAAFPAAGFRLLVLTTSPLGEDKTRAPVLKSGRGFEFVFGIVATGNDQIVYLRLRRHLRGIGLARRAVRELFLRKELNRVDPVPNEARLPERLRKEWDALRFRKLVSSVNPGV